MMFSQCVCTHAHLCICHVCACVRACVCVHMMNQHQEKIVVLVTWRNKILIP